MFILQMIQSYVELIEKTKLQQMNQSLAESPSSPVARPKFVLFLLS